MDEIKLRQRRTKQSTVTRSFIVAMARWRAMWKIEQKKKMGEREVWWCVINRLRGSYLQPTETYQPQLGSDSWQIIRVFFLRCVIYIADVGYHIITTPMGVANNSVLFVVFLKGGFICCWFQIFQFDRYTSAQIEKSETRRVQ